MARIGIRFKLSATLILAAAVPLAVGMVSIHLLGRTYYQRDKGRLFATVSRHLAANLAADLSSQVDHLRDEVRLSGLAQLMEALPTHPEPIAAVEARWAGLSETDPDIRYVLTNRVARNVTAFQRLNPRFAELLVTDAEGRLIGATNKSSDYDQSDETWWQQAMTGGVSRAWLEGILLDESARVYSVDICLPVLSEGEDPTPLGVVKGVLDVSPLFAAIDRVVEERRPFRDVALADGRILVRLFDRTVHPLEETIDAIVMEQIRDAPTDWMVATTSEGTEELVGVTRIDARSGRFAHDHPAAGLTPMYVVVHDSLATVMAPVIRQLRTLTLAGLALLLAFLLVGMYVADRKIVGPIQTLRRAAQIIAAQARLEGARKRNGTPAARPLGAQQTASLFNAVKAIDTSDEIGDLAHDFLLMARRVLRYHEQLESELALKTEEIEQDLVVAREFQEALLPSTYPTVPRVADQNCIALDFFHIYKPATSVGGDFFHMVQISDHEAGVFIADVMGHGARSALITAILRTLLINVARDTADPAELMTRINKQFWALLPREIDFIFATAFYAVFDTRAGDVRFASAGHPPPLLIRHTSSAIDSIKDAVHAGPALGLFEQSTYRASRHAIKPGDVVLLYTDGVIEAPNLDGEEFGDQRLAEVISEHAGSNGEVMATAVVEALHQFMDVVVSPDDICLVTVEIRAGAPPE